MMKMFVALLVALTVPLGAASAVQQTAGSPTDSTYKVGTDDELRVTVFGEEKLSGTFRVDGEGMISYPFLGRVLVDGLNVLEIGQLIQKQLAAGWVKTPQVSVSVEVFRSRFIFVLGQVKQPGMYPLKGEMTLLEMIALAGSVNSDASDEIIVVRSKTGAAAAALTPEDPSANIVARAYLNDLRSGKVVGRLVLENGDTIFVPPAERVFVSGHVRNPSAVAWKRGMTVEQAITLAGGITERGTMRRLAVKRMIDGEVKEIGIRRDDPVLPNDIIVVKMRFI
jgi:polysaccharide export outer membrane protein